jgi:catechol 2,3-dioxygenase-like lactoylglutathione lyase family enzyme
MKINHLMIGCGVRSIQASIDFYCDLLRYKKGEAFIDTGTGRRGTVLTHDQAPEVLMVPIEAESLPSPRHLAIEVSTYQFETILARCEDFGIPTRSQAPIDWTEPGPTEFEQSGREYSHFFVTDPSGLNLEIMVALNRRPELVRSV